MVKWMVALAMGLSLMMAGPAWAQDEAQQVPTVSYVVNISDAGDVVLVLGDGNALYVPAPASEQACTPNEGQRVENGYMLTLYNTDISDLGTTHFDVIVLFIGDDGMTSVVYAR